MKAIKWSDYEQFGCINCGCKYVYADGTYGNEAPVICGECGEKFLILNDLTKISSIGFISEQNQGLIIPKKNMSSEQMMIDYLSAIDFSSPDVKEKLSHGIGIEKNGAVYPIVGPHPRRGIPAHDLVIPDIRPEEKDSDYCYPRGVGYDLACFVKSKEAGERITEMINRVVKDYKDRPFYCHLDYREDEPLWIQIKIAYQNELRARYLEQLIKEHENVITEGIVRNAANKKLDELVAFYAEQKQKLIKK